METPHDPARDRSSASDGRRRDGFGSGSQSEPVRPERAADPCGHRKRPTCRSRHERHDVSSRGPSCGARHERGPAPGPDSGSDADPGSDAGRSARRPRHERHGASG
ncbi:MAG TPA: hypothetical protein DEH03_07055, partial [Brevundimonas sp.]|nr:hypothetical protein [Brevundimonas sp.]